MTSSSFIPGTKFECTLAFTLEANYEMTVDNVSELDVKETILNGTWEKNQRGGGDKYQYEVIVVVADSKRCHYYIRTVWKTGSEKPSNKNKPYRRRKYMKRKEHDNKCPRCSKANLVNGDYPLELSGVKYGEFGGYGCSSCGLVFFKDEPSRQIRQIIMDLDIPPLSISDQVLLLLFATREPIRGAISFMKEAFLLFKEKLGQFDVPALSPHFISYHYGPYSYDVIEEWRELERLGLIARKGRKSTKKEAFFLTPKGRKAAKQIFEVLPVDFKDELPDWRRGLDELGNDGILKVVYKKYPEYTDKSKIREKVLRRGMRRRA